MGLYNYSSVSFCVFAGEEVDVAPVCEIKENFFTPACAAVFLVPQQFSGCALPSNEGLFNRCQPLNYSFLSARFP